MAQITINIPDETLDLVITALCEDTTPTEENAKSKIIDMVKSVVISYEYRQQKEAELAKVAAAEAQAKAVIESIEPTVEASLNIT